MGFKSEIDNFVQFRHAYALAASAAMGSIFYGWDIGLIGGVLAMKSFQTAFGIDQLSTDGKANLNGNIVAILQGGCFFGALSTGYFAGRYGRKPVLLLSGVIYILGSLIQSIVAINTSQATALSLLYFSRFLGGIGVGMVSAAVPSYVSECTPRSIRGRCTGMIQLSNNIGIMLAFWVNYSTNKDIAPGNMQWRIPFIVQMVPGVFFIVAMCFQPESPRWLVEHHKYDRAASALATISGKSVDDPSVQFTLQEIKEDYEGKEMISFFKQIRMMGESHTTALRCFIPSLVMFFQQWTGSNAINYFSPEIFTQLGITGSNSTLFATGIYGVVKVVAVGSVLLFAVENLGRKRCLVYGGFGQAAMMLWIGGYSGIHTSGTVVASSYVSIVAVYIYAIFYCVGFGPVPWVVAAEVAPNHVRSAAMACAIGVNWLFSFTISKITPILLNKIKYGTFLLFGFTCIIMALWAYFFLPETQGYALEDIKYLFEYDMIRRAVGDAPGGGVFLGKRRRATPVAELRAEAEAQAADSKKEKVDDEQREDLHAAPGVTSI